jgi:hypothetical protein
LSERSEFSAVFQGGYAVFVFIRHQKIKEINSGMPAYMASYFTTYGVLAIYFPLGNQKVLAMFRRYYHYLICILLFAFFNIGSALADEVKVTEPLSNETYSKSGASKGIVILAVRWDRKPKCGGYENAQLQVIGFDKLPSQKKNDEEAADLLLDNTSQTMTKPRFENYAFLVVPGEYGLSSLQIKVARSDSDVEIVKTPRSAFLKDGGSQDGTFKVGPGEIVYIGHFHIDCYEQPKLWRYFADGRAIFDKYLASIKITYPMLDVTKVQYRLFQTKKFGRDYHLP